jgi:energy-coupling factor transport system substrate-specific component
VIFGIKEIFKMWGNTRMIVLTAISAAVYASVLIPFKAIPIIPGVTEVRPANALPIICSFMFGPAGAWGAAFGNLIGDFFGTLGPGTLFGFVGNFLYGYIPYKAWKCLSGEEPVSFWGIKSWAKFILILSLASGSCGLFIGWGLDLLGFVPFSALANIITMNNFLVSLILSPFLLFLLYPRVKKWGLLYPDILAEDEMSSGRFSRAGLAVTILAVAGGLILGNLISTGLLGPEAAPGGGSGVGRGVLPLIIILLVGASLL